MKIFSNFMLLVLCIVLNASAFACKGSVVLFQDDFSKMDPAWGVANDQQSVSNNKFIIQPAPNMTHTSLNQANLFQDVDFCADVKLANGDSSNYGGGIVFWAKDYNDNYYLYVLGDGSYYVSRYVNGRFLNPVPTTKDPVINKGNAVNHLRVVTKGNQATIYINDKQLATFTGQPPDGGSLIGFAGDSPANSKNTWEFSNLKITKPQ